MFGGSKPPPYGKRSLVCVKPNYPIYNTALDFAKTTIGQPRTSVPTIEKYPKTPKFFAYFFQKSAVLTFIKNAKQKQNNQP